jgi:hypothetical protein
LSQFHSRNYKSLIDLLVQGNLIEKTHNLGSAEDDAVVHVVFLDGSNAVVPLQELNSLGPRL